MAAAGFEAHLVGDAVANGLLIFCILDSHVVLIDTCNSLFQTHLVGDVAADGLLVSVLLHYRINIS